MDVRTVDLLPRPADEADVLALAELLVDAVASGASVSFFHPLPVADAQAWWRKSLADDRASVLVARDDAGIAGAVMLVPAWAPNQPHRADIAKLMVHRRARKRGLGEALMRAAEAHAARAGFTLLTLDVAEGAEAERLYARLGWRRVGSIPGYALDPDGVTPRDAVLYFIEPR